MLCITEGIEGECVLSSPQLENGFTRIANELLEAVIRTRIPGEANQVLWAVIRQTYGFNRKNATISLGQLAKFTGLSRSNCQRSVQRLVDSNLVLKSEYRGVTTLQIQKDFSKWRVYSKKSTCTQKRVQGVLNTECKTVLNTESPKKKKRQVLKKTSSDALRLSDFSGEDGGIPFPEDFRTSEEFRQVWADWIKFRSELKKPLRSTTIERQAKMLAGFGLAGAIQALENSITNGWMGIFEPNGSGKTNDNGHSGFLAGRPVY